MNVLLLGCCKNTSNDSAGNTKDGIERKEPRLADQIHLCGHGTIAAREDMYTAMWLSPMAMFLECESYCLVEFVIG